MKERARYGIVVSRFNPDITDRLLLGVQKFFAEKKITQKQYRVHYVPGAYEIPLAIKILLEKEKYCGMVAIGCVIKGETTHDELINNAVSSSILKIMIDTDIPVAFGILTVENWQQAIARSQEGGVNRGYEAAKSMIEMVDLIDGLG